MDAEFIMEAFKLTEQEKEWVRAETERHAILHNAHRLEREAFMQDVISMTETVQKSLDELIGVNRETA